MESQKHRKECFAILDFCNRPIQAVPDYNLLSSKAFSCRMQHDKAMKQG
jgi:hypothetical protein